MKQHRGSTASLYRACLTAGIVLLLVISDIDQPATAQPIVQEKQLEESRLTLEVSQAGISIADFLNFRLTVETPANISVTFQTVDDKIGPFRVFSRHPLGPLKQDNEREQWIREYVLEAEQTGELTIPSLWVEIGGTSMAAKTGCVLFLNCDRTTPPSTSSGKQMATDPVTIKVTSIVPEEASITEIKDIAAPAELPPPLESSRPIWQWVLPSTVIAAGLVGLVWWRRYRPKSSDSLTPSQPDHVWALTALAELQQRDLIGQQRMEEFYVGLSSISRRYIAKRFGVPAPEYTTDELLYAVAQRQDEIADWRDPLKHLMQHCDRVKFARYQATSDEMRASLQNARNFVEQTAKPQSESSADKSQRT